MVESHMINYKENVMQKKLRITYAVAFVLLFLTEVYIGLYVRDRFIRPYFGDVLVVILLCCLVRIFIPKGLRLLPAYTFLFATVVEVVQYFDIVKILGFENNALISTLVGRSFSWYDILCYAAGCLLFFISDSIVDRHIHKPA